jgi:uncharacterized OB-fold protein
MQIARSWRQQPTNLRMIGSHCPACGALDFPERIRCARCGAGQLENHRYCGRAEVVTFSLVYEAPRGFADQVPYLAALVRLEEGPIVATMLTDVDPEDVAVGMPVQMVTRRISADGETGPIMYGYKFAPVDEVLP